MFKFTNKRDVDRHVSQMSQKLSENEVRKEIFIMSVHFAILYSQDFLICKLLRQNNCIFLFSIQLSICFIQLITHF